MTLRQGLPALLLACAAVMLLPAPVQAQPAASHEVRRGDSLFAVARKTRHDGVSRNQMILAIWRANQEAFPGGNIHLLEVGTILAIPSRDAAAATESTEADRLVREMLAKPTAAPVPVAAAKPSAVAVPKPSPTPGARAPLGPEESARRYREGLALERKGDQQGALRAYLEAGEAGHGLAQRRLGQIYDKGNTAVQRDYQESLRWYQKAREQGVEIEKPLPRMTTK
jgi:pilus assembly protein FimV